MPESSEKITGAEFAEKLLSVNVTQRNIDRLLEKLSPYHPEMVGWESELLELKGNYHPSPDFPEDPDYDQPNAFEWNVVHAFIALANAHGGCVVLGIAETATHGLVKGDWDPDQIVSRFVGKEQPRTPTGKEFKDLRESVKKSLLSNKPVPQGRRFEFCKRNPGKPKTNQQELVFELDARTVSRLNNLVRFYACHSDIVGCDVIAAIVHPVGKEEPLLEVKRTIRKDGHDQTDQVTFYRDGAMTRELTSHEDYESYKARREPASSDYLRELSEPLQKVPHRDGDAFSTVPGPVPRFIGRTEDLTRLHEDCNEHGITLVHAAGGTGKTQLVFKYVHDHLDDYPGGCFYVPVENCGNWDDVLQTLASQKLSNLGVTTANWLGLETSSTKDKQEDDKGSQNNNRQFMADAADIVNALRQKANANGKLLIVMDNVEDPRNFFTDEKLAKIFPQGIPDNFRCLSTARISRGLYAMCASNVTTFQLADLSEEDALTLLHGNSAFSSEDEKDKARRIIRMLGCRALFVSRVGKLAAEGTRRSYARILERLEYDKLQVAQPLDGEEDTRAPEVIWDWTRQHLEGSQNGEGDLELVRALALFPADGIPERILEALYYSEFGNLDAQTTLDKFREDPDLFQDAVKRLEEFSVVHRTQSDGRKENIKDRIIQMHRLDRMAIRKDLGEKLEPLKQEIGTALKKCICCESTDWIEFARAHSELMEFCPWELLYGHEQAAILKAMPECQKYGVLWNRLSDYDWTELVLHRPEFASRPECQPLFLSPLLAQIKELRPRFIMADLPGGIWARLLQNEPELISECPLHKLKLDDWLLVLCSQPQLFEYCDHPEILGARGNLQTSPIYDQVQFPVWESANWGKLLACHPEFATRCNENNLSPVEVVSILTHASNFADQIPKSAIEQLTGEQWTDLIATNPEVWKLNLYPKDIFPRKVRSSSMNIYCWDLFWNEHTVQDRGISWAEAIRKNPKVREVCPFSELSVEEWILLLLNDIPIFNESPPWERIAHFLSENDLWYHSKTLFEDNPIGAQLKYEQLDKYRPEVDSNAPTPLLVSCRPSPTQLAYVKRLSLSKICASPWGQDDASEQRQCCEAHSQLTQLFPEVNLEDLLRRDGIPFNININLSIPHNLDFGHFCRVLLPTNPEGTECEWEDEYHYGLGDTMCGVSSNLSNYHAHRGPNLPPAHNSHEWAFLISCCPQFADHPKCDWSKFDGKEQCLILANHPSLRDRCDFKKFTGRDWAALLAEDPSFADKCDWSLLDDSDWEYLLNDRPWFAEKRG